MAQNGIEARAMRVTLLPRTSLKCWLWVVYCTVEEKYATRYRPLSGHPGPNPIKMLQNAKQRYHEFPSTGDIIARSSYGYSQVMIYILSLKIHPVYMFLKTNGNLWHFPALSAVFGHRMLPQTTTVSFLQAEFCQNNTNRCSMFMRNLLAKH